MSSMKKKTVLKVSTSGEKARTEIITAVAKLKGVEQITLDAARQILTVVGEVDPCLIAKKVNKTGNKAEVLDVKTARSIQELSRPSYYGSNDRDYYYGYNNNNISDYDSSYNNYCPPRIAYDCPPGIVRPPQPEYCYKGGYKVIYNDAPGDCTIL